MCAIVRGGGAGEPHYPRGGEYNIIRNGRFDCDGGGVEWSGGVWLGWGFWHTVVVMVDD